MLTPPQNWQPCFVDPWRGVAHFDGLTIEADPITSPRQDFVLPCIEDEQVFFCRMLRALLPARADREERHAVDLGMGSGVLSLYAASLGMRVTGIDVCDRAMHFADYNLRKNQAVLPRSIERVKFAHFDWNDSMRLQPLNGHADYVLVNAPFSPSRDGRSIARCVSGGIVGQDAFLETLPIAYSLVKEQGRVYAIQLLLTDDQGNPKNDLFKVTGSQNDRWSSVRVFKALEPVSVRDFLDGQYRSVSNASGSASSETYSNAFFCFAFLELTKGGATQEHEVELVSPASNPLAPLPNWTWDKRIDLHRRVSENYSRYQNSPHESKNGSEDQEVEHRARIWTPSIALFLQRTNPDSALQPEPGDSSSNEISKVLRPTQLQIDHWMRHNDFLRGPCNPDRFDCLMVEAVPWHFATNRLNLRTETALWAGAENGCDATHVSRALDRVLVEIMRFVKEQRSIFLHPEHLRATNAQAWQQAVCYYQSECGGDIYEPTQEPQFENKPPACRQGDILVSSHLHELKKFGTRSNNPSTKPFESCLRRALRAYTGIMRLEGLLSKGTSHCYFLSLPIPLLKPKSRHAESGVVYVYAWSPQPWSTPHECKVSDLARLASFLYEELYSESTRFQLDLNLRQSMLVSAGHETKELIVKIKDRISPIFAQLLQSYLLLLFEQPLEKTFPDLSQSLTQGKDSALHELSAMAYVIQQLCGETFDPRELNEGIITSWKKEASRLIQIDSTSFAAKVQITDTKKQLHFTASFIAGLRNALSHTYKSGNVNPIIVIKREGGLIRIQNSYKNILNDDEEQERMKDKREKEISGTESVLQYHESRAFNEDPAFQPVSRIVKIQNEKPRDTDYFQHTWVTELPVPCVDKEATT